MTKTQRAYEKLFEDLMEFSDFNSVEEIIGDTKQETNQNLDNMFTDINKDANSKGRRNPMTLRLRNAMKDAFIRIARVPVERKQKIQTRKEKVIKGKFFKNIKDARASLLTIDNEKGQEVFRTQILVKDKKIERFRDAKGRFARRPV